MNINKKSLNIENHFIKNGYYIFDANNEGLNSIKSLRKKILNYTLKKYPKIKDKYKNESLIFEKMHSFIPKKSLNEFRLQIVDIINNDKNCSDNYYLAAKEGLDLLVGNEIAMQKKLNFSVQMPNDKDSRLPMHSDIYAGESPFEVVVWIPLMNVQNSSHAMFITNPKHNKIINGEVTYGSNTTIDKIYKKHKKKFKFIKINFGQILIFSPILLHGNIINKTDITRVSLNCRFKSLLSPFDVFSKTHRNIPHFFKPLTTKALTKVGFNFINSVERKSEKKK